MDPKEKAYLAFLEEEFAKEDQEVAEKRVRLARAHSKTDMSANSPLREWVCSVCMGMGLFGLSSLLAIGIGWMINTGMRGPLLK